ncbi:hypothetical protein DPMN_077113 [Dreissena polymorpha]|uniref:Uncharacterized protein n=1 Tax=Dreissena polymorpha TaxID=45954 RepID=A0A9D3YLC3_DREPO|nr:hypothetical protein DPMN_077113 [Dreissena polymorpha]
MVESVRDLYAKLICKKSGQAAANLTDRELFSQRNCACPGKASRLETYPSHRKLKQTSLQKPSPRPRPASLASLPTTSRNRKRTTVTSRSLKLKRHSRGPRAPHLH